MNFALFLVCNTNILYNMKKFKSYIGRNVDGNKKGYFTIKNIY